MVIVIKIVVCQKFNLCYSIVFDYFLEIIPFSRATDDPILVDSGHGFHDLSPPGYIACLVSSASSTFNR